MNTHPGCAPPLARLLTALMLCQAAYAAGQCPPVVPGFSWHSEGDAVRFTDETESVFAPIENETWAFGDGAADIGYSVAYTYGAGGIDTVHLSFSAGGCDFSIPGLVAHGMTGDVCGLDLFSDFSASSVGNNVLAFSDASSAPTDVAYLWAFGDGAIDLSSDPVHPFVFPGGYDVTHSIAALDTIAQVGCVAGRARHVRVDGNASTCDTSLFLNINANYFDGFAAFNATAEVLNPDLTILSAVWDFGDGSTDVGLSPDIQHYYAAPGSYQVCVTIQAIHSSTQELCEAHACQTLVPALTGYSEQKDRADLRAFPDPFTDDLNIEFGPLSDNGFWSLLDARGCAVRSGTVPVSGRSHLETAGLSSGLYFMLVRSSLGTSGIKVMRR